MAAPVGVQTDPVTERILAEPLKQDFFFTVRWLWRRCAQDKTALEAPPVGLARLASRDPIRFTQTPSMSFAPSTLDGVERRDSGGYRIGVRFFGLLGPHGPLPLHVTDEAIRRRLDARDTTLQDFFNLFNHRMTSFYYRAWACQQMVVDADRFEESRIARYVGSLCGLERSEDRRRDSLPESAKLYFAGLLAIPTRPGEGLANLLGEYFETGARIEPFAGSWVSIPRSQRCRLTSGKDARALGRSAVLGQSAWEVSQRMRIRLGPMSLRKFERLLPSGPGHVRLLDWVRLYAGGEIGCDVVLVLKAEEVPRAQLGVQGRLGWTTWLSSSQSEIDRDDAVITAAA